MGLFSKKDMEELIEQLNQDETVENARIVEFLGKPHIHIDLESGDIETITEDGTERFTPIRKGSSRSN